jgi:GDP-4-dehydro-6-deoxy-D-mannose reductase
VKVLVTGADGFVGRWLIAEFERAGHEPNAAPSHHDLDFSAPTAAAAFAEVVRRVAPDAAVHLAAVSFAPDADRSPDRAIDVNGRGTAAFFAGLDLASSPALALVVSSADVYGTPTHLPIAESAPLLAARPYGLSKLQQERETLAAHARGRRVLISRSFNQVGPGQREEFVAPALARRVLAVKHRGASGITMGNFDVRRDFTDVRDVVRAYRLLLEAMVDGDLAVDPPILNIGSGHAIAIRELLETLCRIADVPMTIRQDPKLVRPNEAPEIRADISLVQSLVGWAPQIPLEQSLADLLASLE